ncbi:MAG: CBS domain-containing protein [Thermodesulfobacteriota bacterium]
MNTKVADLMIKNIINCQPHHSIDFVRNLMRINKVHAVLIIDKDDDLKGMVSTFDLTYNFKQNTPVKNIMTEKVFTIPMHNDIHHAARLMRKHKVHHVVVTHEKKVVGILSSFDLLKLVEKHRFIMKPAPSKSNKRNIN